MNVSVPFTEAWTAGFELSIVVFVRLIGMKRSPSLHEVLAAGAQNPSHCSVLEQTL